MTNQRAGREAQLLGEEIITGECLLGDTVSDRSSGRNPPKASGFILTKLAAKRWQVIAFAADREVIVTV